MKARRIWGGWLMTIAMAATLVGCQCSNNGNDGTENKPSLNKKEHYDQIEVPSNLSENRLTFTIDGVSFTMVRVEGGSFYMGAQNKDAAGKNYDPDADENESPVRPDTVGTFYIAETEVTQALWTAVTGDDSLQKNPPKFEGVPEQDYIGPERPMCFVSAVNAERFTEILNEVTGCKFRLPTEAEWEFAARGGNHSKGYRYSGSNDIDDVAWYYGNTDGKGSHDVKTKAANELGLYDMSGSACEWVSDEWNRFVHSDTPMTFRTNRGGSWYDKKENCRVSSREGEDEVASFNVIGFRLVLQAQE